MNNKRQPSHPYHSGNYKGFRNLVQGTEDTNQIYRSYIIVTHRSFLTLGPVENFIHLSTNIFMSVSHVRAKQAKEYLL